MLSFTVTTLIVFALGASVGSFLNVVIYRIPAGLSLLHPPSRCPKCLKRLRAYDNVPVLGWLRLKGRCRYCRSPIAVRYPLVESVTGLLFVVTFWTFSLSLLTVGYWFFFSWLIALALIDLDTMTLPVLPMQSGLVAGLIFQAATGWFNSHNSAGIASHLMTGILGAVVGIWLFDAIYIFGWLFLGQEAMGKGDAMLAAMMGAWLGCKLLLLSSFLACVIGALVGGGAVALGLLKRRQPMPFGPFLALGALLAAFFGEAIVSTYLQLFFPMV